LPQAKTRRPGRPKLPKGDAKSSIVPIRLNAEDRKRVEAAARASNKSVSEWIRGALSAAIGA
jgi:predicted HicB family RNase H-like nuclease